MTKHKHQPIKVNIDPSNLSKEHAILLKHLTDQVFHDMERSGSNGVYLPQINSYPYKPYTTMIDGKEYEISLINYSVLVRRRERGKKGYRVEVGNLEPKLTDKDPISKMKGEGSNGKVFELIKLLIPTHNKLVAINYWSGSNLLPDTKPRRLAKRIELAKDVANDAYDNDAYKDFANEIDIGKAFPDNHQKSAIYMDAKTGVSIMREFNIGLFDLLTRFKNAPPNFEQALTLTIDLLHAAQIMHKYSIAHIDLKSENIMAKTIDRANFKYEFYPIDFGTSKNLKSHDENEKYPFLGTPGYQAPKLANLAHNSNMTLTQNDLEHFDVYAIFVCIMQIWGGNQPDAESKTPLDLNTLFKFGSTLDRIESPLLNRIKEYVTDVLQNNGYEKITLIDAINYFEEIRLTHQKSKTDNAALVEPMKKTYEAAVTARDKLSKIEIDSIDANTENGKNSVYALEDLKQPTQPVEDRDFTQAFINRKNQIKKIIEDALPSDANIPVFIETLRVNAFAGLQSKDQVLNKIEEQFRELHKNIEILLGMQDRLYTIYGNISKTDKLPHDNMITKLIDSIDETLTKDRKYALTIDNIALLNEKYSKAIGRIKKSKEYIYGCNLNNFNLENLKTKIKDVIQNYTTKSNTDLNKGLGRHAYSIDRILEMQHLEKILDNSNSLGSLILQIEHVTKDMKDGLFFKSILKSELSKVIGEAKEKFDLLCKGEAYSPVRLKKN